MTLTKANIVDSIKDQLGLSRKQSIETVEALLEIMKKTMEKGSGTSRFICSASSCWMMLLITKTPGKKSVDYTRKI